MIIKIINIISIFVSISLTIYGINYRFSNPCLTETQLFIDTWKIVVIDLIFVCIYLFTKHSWKK